MPLRQFRARARSLTFLHYGQWRSRPRRIAVRPSNPLAPPLRASPRRALEFRRSRAASSTNSRTAISFAALRTVGAPLPAASARRASANAGKRIGSGSSKVERRDAGQIEPRRRRLHAHRPGQTMRDRNTHIGRAKLGDHRAVAELDQPMHDRLRMNDHVERLGPSANRWWASINSSPLFIRVAEVDRDLRPHRPSRMLERLLHRHLADRLDRPGAERTAGGGQHDAAYVLAPAGAEGLEDGVVLGIHRQDGGAGCGCAPHEQRTGADETFLVGERNSARRARPRPTSA